MDRNRVVNSASNSLLSQKPYDLIPVVNPNRVDVVDVADPLCLDRPDKFFDAVQCLIIMCRVRPAELIASFKKSEFDSQNGCLDSVHATVPSDHDVMILADLAVISQNPNLLLQLGIVSHHCAGLTESTKILPRVEAEAASLAKASHLPSLVFGSMCLAGILDNIHTPFSGDSRDGIHVRRLTKKVDRYDRLCSRRNRFLQRGRIHRVSTLIDIDKHRLGAAVGNRLRSGDESIWYRDHLVCGSDAQRQKSQPERFCAAANTNCMKAIAVRREFRFKVGDERTAGEGSGINDFLNRTDEFSPYRHVVRSQVKKGD